MAPPGTALPAQPCLGGSLTAPRCLPSSPSVLQVTSGTRDLLPAAAAAALKCLGRVPMRCCGGQEEELWGLPDHGALPLTTVRYVGLSPALPAGEPLVTDQPMEEEEEALPSAYSTPAATAPSSPPPEGKLAPLAPALADDGCDDGAPVTPPHTAIPAALSKALGAAQQQRSRAVAHALCV